MIYLLGLVTGVLVCLAVPFVRFVVSTPASAMHALAREESRFLLACGWRRRPGGRADEWLVPPGYPYRVKYTHGYTRRHAVNAQVLALHDEAYWSGMRRAGFAGEVER